MKENDIILITDKECPSYGKKAKVFYVMDNGVFAELIENGKKYFWKIGSFKKSR